MNEADEERYLRNYYGIKFLHEMKCEDTTDLKYRQQMYW